MPGHGASSWAKIDRGREKNKKAPSKHCRRAEGVADPLTNDCYPHSPRFDPEGLICPMNSRRTAGIREPGMSSHMPLLRWIPKSGVLRWISKTRKSTRTPKRDPIPPSGCLRLRSRPVTDFAGRNPARATAGSLKSPWRTLQRMAFFGGCLGERRNTTLCYHWWEYTLCVSLSLSLPPSLPPSLSLSLSLYVL